MISLQVARSNASSDNEAGQIEFFNKPGVDIMPHSKASIGLGSNATLSPITEKGDFSILCPGLKSKTSETI